MLSIAFVTYTGIYFIKSRGKEIGLYLTLGMTTKDLIRMVGFESLVIVIGSSLCGLLSGWILSGLFYMILEKILAIETSIYYIDYRTFLLSLGTFGLVYLCNMLFAYRFIRKLSIVEITKSTSTKGISKSHPIIGCVSLLIFGSSLWFSNAAFSGNELVRELIRETSMSVLMLSLIGIFVSLYFILSFSIGGIRVILKRFPKLYNRALLLLSNLSHRFFSYKVNLYIVSMLIAMGVFFIGVGYIFYAFTDIRIENYVPYDFMIETNGGINDISEQEVKSIVTDNGGIFKSFSALEFVNNVNYMDTQDGFIYSDIDSILISESNFNKHMGLSIDLAPEEILILYNEPELAAKPITYDTLITIEPWREGIDRANAFRDNPLDIETFKDSLGDTPFLFYHVENTDSMYAAFINSYGNAEFDTVIANVVDDVVYESINTPRYMLYLFDVKSDNKEKIFNAILASLRIKNNADDSLWASEEIDFGQKDNIQHLRPIYKAERHKIVFRMAGFILFSLAFLGILFLLASIVVLYYKIASDVDGEKEQIMLLQKVGLSQKECRSYLQSHLAVVFACPFVIGGILGLYFVNILLLSVLDPGNLMQQVLVLYGLLAVLDILFYFSLRRNLFRGVGL
ncbi:MAG TPA: ABC transporter permease [Clostridia bacterium]|nr:ABC transporter permease [Clostridia bacterium]